MNIQWDLGDGLTLESITGSVNSRDIVQQDFDNSTLATVAVPLPQLHTLRNQNFQQTSEELRLSGDPDVEHDVHGRRACTTTRR